MSGGGRRGYKRGVPHDWNDSGRIPIPRPKTTRVKEKFTFVERHSSAARSKTEAPQTRAEAPQLRANAHRLDSSPQSAGPGRSSRPVPPRRAAAGPSRGLRERRGSRSRSPPRRPRVTLTKGATVRGHRRPRDNGSAADRRQLLQRIEFLESERAKAVKQKQQAEGQLQYLIDKTEKTKAAQILIIEKHKEELKRCAETEKTLIQAFNTQRTRIELEKKNSVASLHAKVVELQKELKLRHNVRETTHGGTYLRQTSRDLLSKALVLANAKKNLNVRVKESRLVEDMIRHFSSHATTERQLIKKPYVRVVDEQTSNGKRRKYQKGIDEGGLSKQVFSDFFHQLVSYRIGQEMSRPMFERVGSVLLPALRQNALSKDEEGAFVAVGRAIAVAVAHRILIPPGFMSGILLDFLMSREHLNVMALGQKTEADFSADMKDVPPLAMLEEKWTQYRDGQYQPSLDEIKNLYTSFGVHAPPEELQWMRLRARGVSGSTFTTDRRATVQAFAWLYHHTVLNPRLPGLVAMRRGFWTLSILDPWLSVLPTRKDRMRQIAAEDVPLRAQDVNAALCTKQRDFLSFLTLKQVIKDWGADDKIWLSRFLRFVTGYRFLDGTVITVESFDAARDVAAGMDASNRLPEARTCFSTLTIPPTTTKEKLRTNLQKAIQLTQSFAIE